MSKVFTRVYTEGWQDYELIDAGGGKKLERFGKIIIIKFLIDKFCYCTRFCNCTGSSIRLCK